MGMYSKLSSWIIYLRTYRQLQPFFDTNFYLQRYPDVAKARMDPLKHFIKFGAAEKRDPNANFSVSYYLSSYPDVARSGMNPFFHFIVFGRGEGRRTKASRSLPRQILATAESPQARSKRFAPPQSVQRIEQQAFFEIVNNRERLAKRVFSFGHDDHTRNYGGIQNVISDEIPAFNKRGWDYFYFHPALQLAQLSTDTNPGAHFLNVSLNGELIGAMAFDDILNVVRGSSAKNNLVIFHQLLGHSPELLGKFVSSLNSFKCYFWAHDFFGLCSNYTLLRNGISYCGAPHTKSMACQICTDGDERKSHLPRIKRLLVSSRAEILAPSEAAAEVLDRAGLRNKEKIRILPLAQLRQMRGVEPAGRTSQPLRVSYQGSKSFHKGWHVFESLVEKFGSDPRYEFFYFGADSAPGTRPGLSEEDVVVTRDKRLAMRNAIADAQIDVAIIWPLWPETFSFVTFEALSAGAFVLTNLSSGNVAKTVSLLGRKSGICLASVPDLHDLFQSGRIVELLQRRSRRQSKLDILPGTASVIVGGRKARRKN